MRTSRRCAPLVIVAPRRGENSSPGSSTFAPSSSDDSSESRPHNLHLAALPLDVDFNEDPIGGSVDENLQVEGASFPAPLLLRLLADARLAVPLNQVVVGTKFSVENRDRFERLLAGGNERDRADDLRGLSAEQFRRKDIGQQVGEGRSALRRDVIPANRRRFHPLRVRRPNGQCLPVRFDLANGPHERVRPRFPLQEVVCGSRFEERAGLFGRAAPPPQVGAVSRRPCGGLGPPGDRMFVTANSPPWSGPGRSAFK